MINAGCSEIYSLGFMQLSKKPRIYIYECYLPLVYYFRLWFPGGVHHLVVLWNLPNQVMICHIDGQMSLQGMAVELLTSVLYVMKWRTIFL